MKQYTVIALSVGGRGNKIFSSGDTVSENDFIPGRAEELVQQKFLKEYTPEAPVNTGGNATPLNTEQTGNTAGGGDKAPDTTAATATEGEGDKAPGADATTSNTESEGDKETATEDTGDKTPDADTEAGKTEAAPLVAVGDVQPYTEGITIDTYNKEKLQGFLTGNKIAFDAKATKVALFDIYKNA